MPRIVKLGRLPGIGLVIGEISLDGKYSGRVCETRGQIGARLETVLQTWMWVAARENEAGLMKRGNGVEDGEDWN